MSKFFIFARASDDTDRGAYVNWFAATAAPEFLASVAAHGTIDSVDIAPNFALNLTTAPSGLPAYDAVLSVYTDTFSLSSLAGLHRTSSRLDVYEVEEAVMFDRRAPDAAPSGAKYIGLGLWHSDLPAGAARRMWIEHAALVPRIHVGASRYVQNYTIRALNNDAPKLDCVAELYFPTLPDFEQRFYASAAGRDEVRNDIIRFTASAKVLFAREHRPGTRAPTF